MRLRNLLLILALAVTAQGKAQIGIYGTVTGSRVGNITPPYPQTGTYGFWAVGGGLGIYDDFAHFGPVHLGADLRGSFLNSKGHQLNSGLAGLRFVFKPPVAPFRPYLQASVGGGTTNFGSGNNMTTGLQYQVFGGLDFTFFPRLDWRIIEVGGGGFHVFNTANTGTDFPIATVSTGLVLRFP
jgi:hypothetical protein